MLTEWGGSAEDQGPVEAVRFEKAVMGTWGVSFIESRVWLDGSRLLWVHPAGSVEMSRSRR